jgi:hypothetical protein
MSVTLPATAGTMIRSGFVGHGASWASDALDESAAAQVRRPREMSLRMVSFVERYGWIELYAPTPNGAILSRLSGASTFG